MKTFFRFLLRNKFYSFVTIFGFAVSLMFVFLIAVYVKQELSVDNFHEKKDRIYLLATANSFGLRYSYAAMVKDHLPEVEEALPLALDHEEYVVRINDEPLKVSTHIVGNNFFHVFSFPLLQGNPNLVLQAPGNAVISESFARKVFGDKDPIGEVIAYDNSVTVTVAGVMKDIKQSIIPYADIILPYENLRSFQEHMDQSSGFARVAVLARPGVDLRTKDEAITQYFKEREEWDYQYVLNEKAQFIPLSDAYFSELYGGAFNKGDKSFVMILMAVGLVILLFAMFNYINLTVAQTGFRAKEMATRNLLGANPGESFIRLILESTVLIAVSLALGILLAFFCVSYVSNLLNRELLLADAFTPLNILAMLLIVIVLGAVSGLFPAYMISKFKPIDVVKGSFKVRSKMKFSKVFIVIQNALTIVLITTSIVMGEQVKHLVQAPLGYNTDNIIVINIEDRSTWRTLVAEFEQLASVKRVASASSVPLVDMSYSTFINNEKVIAYYIIEGDSVFFDMLGFDILQDNNLAYDHVNYFTESSYNVLEMDDNEIVMPAWNWHVGGKVKDIKIGSILNNRDNSITVISKKNTNRFRSERILVEVQGDPTLTFNQIKAIYKNTTGLEFSGRYMEEILESYFAEQTRLRKIINLFAGMAILISLLGLIAISTYFIRQRKKEIAVKKILGASTESVMMSLVKSFLTYVAIAFVIAVPVAYYFMNGWLDDYSYRISLNPLYFIAAGAFALFISALTVFWQSYRAANANPVDALKN